VVIADDQGGIAWVPAGRCPGARPSLVRPPSGLIVSCNNGNARSRTAGLGWNFFPGDRARRVAATMRTRPAVDETTESRRQHDVEAAPFRYYRDLALRHLPDEGPEVVVRLREQVSAWRGTAAPSEYGLPLLVAFRDLLRERMIAATTRPCQRYDPEFAYCYHGPDGPLRLMVTALEDGLLPAPAPFPNVSRFVLTQLLMANALVAHRAATTGAATAGPVRWGQVNRLRLVSTAPSSPSSGPDLELAGCPESVCVAQEDFGAAVRLVVRLGSPTVATVSIPGSQSGTTQTNADAIAAWAAGRPTRLR
jgi:penicillin amidase